MPCRPRRTGSSRPTVRSRTSGRLASKPSTWHAATSRFSILHVRALERLLHEPAAVHYRGRVERSVRDHRPGARDYRSGGAAMKLTDCSRRLTCVAVVALGCVAVPLFAQRGPFGLVPTWGLSWALHGSMPFERSETAAVEINGKIYVIAGNSRGNEANSLLQEYDPATGAWRERALMPSVASHAGAAALNGKIYVVGGFVANVHVGAVNRVFEYDPAADRWRAVAPLSAPRGSPGVVALNGRLHAIGGRDPQQKTVAMHEVYDP